MMPNSSQAALIIPTYNRLDLVLRCYESIITQTLENYVAVFVDGGSSDGTYEFLANHAKKDRRIIVLKQSGVGIGNARNEGIDYVKNHLKPNWLFFLDSDDYVERDYLAKMVDYGNRYQSDVIMCDHLVHYAERNDRVFLSRILSSGSTSKADSLTCLEHFLAGTITPVVWAKAFRFAFADSMRFIDGIVECEDRPYLVDLFLSEPTVTIVDYPGYHYQSGFCHPSITKSSLTNARLLAGMESYLHIFKALTSACFTFSDSNRKETHETIMLSRIFGSIGRFDLRHASQEEKRLFSKSVSEIRNAGVVKNVHPKTGKLSLLRFAFLLSPFLLRVIYRVFRTHL